MCHVILRIKLALMLHTGGTALQEANFPFERHLFRQLEQEVDETVDQFVCQLRQKSLSCDFADEAIRDQLIEKCCDV